MANRGPGDPLNPEQVAGVQGALPTNGFLVPSCVKLVGYGLYHMGIPTVVPVQLDHANYNSHDVPFQKMSTDYQP